jgi:signal transduction histidine kinase
MSIEIDKARRSASFVLLALLATVGRCYAVQSEEVLDREWLVSSLLSGTRLADRNLFDIAFEPGGPSGIKKIWVASSDGLYAFDGYQWQQYTTADGLPSNFVRSVRFTKAGALWVGTSEGAGILEGKTFSRRGSEKGLAGKNVRRIIEDAEGALWFCSDSWPLDTGQGGLARLKSGRWQNWHTSDGLPSDYVVNYFRNSEGRQFAATSEGLAELRGTKWVRLLLGPASAHWNWGSTSFAESSQFGMMVSTGEQVFVLKNGRWLQFPGVLRHQHGITATSDGKIIAAGSKNPYQKTFLEWRGSNWQPVSATFHATHDYVEDVREGPDGSIYAIGFDCLTRWQRRRSEWWILPWKSQPQFIDSDGAVWSMDDKGLFATQNDSWKSFGQSFEGLLRTSTGVLAWAEHAVSRLNRSGEVVPLINAHDFEIERVDLDSKENLWVAGLDKSGEQRLRRYQKSSSRQGRWTNIDIPKCSWIVGAADPIRGMWYLARKVDGSAVILRIEDDKMKGYGVPPQFISRYSNSIYVDRRGGLWLYGDTGLHQWQKDKLTWREIPGLLGHSVTGCIERGNQIWFVVDGTVGGRSGLAVDAGGQWKQFDTDPISSWSLAENGRLLFGSKGRFYVVPVSGDLSPIVIRLPEPEQVTGVLEDRNRTFWLGTSQGIFLFRPSKAAPQTAFVSYDREVLEGGTYRARARTIPLFHLGVVSTFAYSWSVDDAAWSPFDARAERTFEAKGLSVGAHRLRVRARDNSMNVDESPATITFEIHQLPLQEHKWFLPLMTCLLLLLLGLSASTAIARSKLARQAQQLEDMVETRTSELKVREEDLRRSNAALQRINEDLRQFSWAASHDLQEPLRMVVTYTQLFSKRYQDQSDEKGKQFLSFAVEGAYRMQQLLQALLEYWQVSESPIGNSDHGDANVALRKAIDNVELLVRENRAVVTHSQLPVVNANETALTQLFQNLISNAIKYRHPQNEPKIEISCEHRNGSGWLFSVQDNGIGIPPEYRELIFKLFKRLQTNQRRGSGIGLALCAKIVENFGGRIWVESELGEGSTFHFIVPG